MYSVFSLIQAADSKFDAHTQKNNQGSEDTEAD